MRSRQRSTYSFSLLPPFGFPGIRSGERGELLQRRNTATPPSIEASNFCGRMSLHHVRGVRRLGKRRESQCEQERHRRLKRSALRPIHHRRLRERGIATAARAALVVAVHWPHQRFMRYIAPNGPDPRSELSEHIATLKKRRIPSKLDSDSGRPVLEI